MKKRLTVLFLAAALLAFGGCGKTVAAAQITSADNLYGAVFSLTLEDLTDDINNAFDSRYGGQLIDDSLGWTEADKSQDYYGILVDTWMCTLQAGVDITLAVDVAVDTGLVEDVMLMVGADAYEEEESVFRQAAASLAMAVLPGLSGSEAEKFYDDMAASLGGDKQYFAGGNTLWDFSATSSTDMLTCHAVSDAYLAAKTSAGMQFGTIE